MQRRLITGKRKVDAAEAEVPSVGTSRGKKSKTSKNHPETGKPSAAQGNSKSNSQDDSKWPDYFKEVSICKDALNTVLAFCTSRKQFATSFDSLRASVEGLLKRLLARVAEIKVLVPELLTFAYTPANHLKFNSSTQQRTSQEDVYSDYANNARPTSYDESDHVLVLEMDDSMVRKKKLLTDSQVVLQPLDPASLKQLIEKRNAQFFGAIEEYEACPDAEDPVTLLVALARDHIPLTITSTGDEAEPQNIPDPENRRSIDGIVEEIYEQKWYQDQIKYRRTFDAKPGSIGTVDPPLSDSIRAALLDARKISTLYTHQATAIAALSQGKNVIVSTSTASGKSVIYQVPLLRILEQDEGAKALFIYPTKALAQDQKAALEQLLACCPGLEHIPISTYDGDTPQDARPTIRDTASVLFTNIDTIHASILPHEERWRRFLKNLKLVAVDELHYYHDMLGSHVALVMRRLRRICVAVGNRHIRFVSCSATISRPKEHMKTIFGLEDVEAITQDEAPSGRKEFLLWRYPDVSKASPISEATRVMSYLMKRGIRVILFCRTRKSCELAMKSLRTTLSMEQRYDILDKVKPYRGGYQPSERRQIEQEAFSGRLLGLVATNALELGVDIGVLDAVIVCGFPVSVASFRQQIGRAGRRARDSLAIYVAEQSGTDSHYVAYPDDLFDKPTSDLVVNLESPVIIEAHLQCAALEMPLSSDDARWFGPLTKTICENNLVRDQEGWFHTHPKHLPHPAGALSIRGAEEEKYAVIDVSSSGFGVKGRILEETEVSRALFELYEGAIFLHQGKTFLVKEINHDSKQARLVRTDVGWITTPRYFHFRISDPIQTWRIREVKASPRRALYGRVDVRTIVYGTLLTARCLHYVADVDMPPYENITTGMWLDVTKEALHFLDIEAISRAEAIHSASHAFLNQFPMAGDLRTECKPIEKEMKATESARKRPARLIFYDPVGRSIGGVAAKAFDHGTSPSDFLIHALEAVTSCDCLEGCENCILSSLCRKGNEVMSKRGALVILKDILGIPLGEPEPIEDEDVDPRPLTVIEAPSVGIAEGVVVEKYDA
ncbi:P-loop containing nucleoside triphosphate hydrolase protein [Lactarius akahatsu]|uniref:P-loop containing nucleoside triphosphate hydrolase protein n=1 Tax=Lactarius akahatsu TaxID=416441 RepID=A0AAD4LRS0_9AGAM|nr:P-loop containing nucleoside triphosphate hydrolase protein [Lactarius akahatsu]